MNLIPVIERELRAQARQPATYYLRLVATALLVGVFALMTTWGQALQGAQVGRQLFLNLNITAYYVIWLGVPLLVADAISGEKREGTLGLLFLTSLQAADVVLGKGLILSWRALGLLLAGMPVLVLPFLFGGVSWRNAVFMLGSHLLSLLTALAAGLTASSLSRHFVRAVLGGLLLSALGSLLFNAVLELLCFQRLEDFWNGVSLLARVTQYIDLAGRNNLGRAMLVQFAVWVALATALLWMVVRQVEEFWQEGELTSRRAQNAAAAWTRLLVRIGVGLSAVVIGFSFWRWPDRAVLAIMCLLSAACSLVCWIGTIAAVIRYGMRTRPQGHSGRSLPGLSAGGAGDPTRPSDRWTRWGLVAMGGVLLALLAETVALKVLPWPVAVVVVVNHLSAACLAFGAGWLAWGWGRSWMRAVVRGVALGMLFFCVMSLVCAVVLAHVGNRTEVNGWRDFFDMGWHQIFLAGAMAESGAYLFAAHELWRFGPTWWLLDSLLLLVLSAVFSMLCVAVGTRWAEGGERADHDDPAAALTKDLSEPLFARGFFQRRRDRLLERNPMRWLLERTRTARLHRAGWLALVTVAETVMACQYRSLDLSEIWVWQQGLLLVLAFGLALSSAMSFQEERRTGAMELILVTPVQIRQIVMGRWQGLLAQFVPSFILIAVVLMFGHSLDLGMVWWRPFGLMVGEAGLCSFISVPFVGMYASLRYRSLAAAWGLTLSVPVLNTVVLFGLVRLGGLFDLNSMGIGGPVEEVAARFIRMVGLLLVLPLNLWVAWNFSQKLWRHLRGQSTWR